MNLRTWSFYRLVDGSLTGRRYAATTDESLQDNTPEGCAAIEGEYNHLCQRVDPDTGKVEDFVPAAPSADYQWDAEHLRFRLTPAAEAALNADRAARGVIAEQESRQLRAMRDVLLNPGDASAIQRLRDIESAIAAVRPNIRRTPPA